VIHQLHRSQIIHASLPECWAFFSNPANLTRITPPDLDFRVLRELPPAIYAGLLIEYHVRPLFGIQLTWLTEITHVEGHRYFIDEQRVGPYRLWHHEHHFQAVGQTQTEMRDLVYYALPFSPWSELCHFVVKPRLQQIFDYREKVVNEVFTVPPRAASASA